jgi:hypothetical protein
MSVPRAWGPKPGQDPFGKFGQGPVTPKTPKITKPGKTRVQKPGVPAARVVADPATDAAMNAFRVALKQLQTTVAPVDQGAIYAPYRQSEAVTGQLGTGYQTAMQNAGNAASSQYTTGLNAAQEAAARFGISAGSGAGPTALQNTGTEGIAKQTQADSASAAAGTAAWQALLERAAAAKVSDATLQRSGLLSQAGAQLATNIPSAIGNEKQLDFQRHASDANNAYLLSSLDQKGQDSFRQYILDQQKLATGAQHDNATLTLAQQRLAETQRHNLETEKATTAKQKQAAKAGIKGISQASAALRGPKPSSTTKTAKGWDVQVQPVDEDGEMIGSVTTLRLPSKTVPKGYKFISAKTHYENLPSSAASTFSWSRYKRALAILKSQNPGVPVGQLIPLLGPTPKTK